MVPPLQPPRDESQRTTPLLPTAGVDAEAVFDLPYAVDDRPLPPPPTLPPPPVANPALSTLPPPPAPVLPPTFSSPRSMSADATTATPTQAREAAGQAPLPAPLNAGPLAGSGLFGDDDTFAPEPEPQLPPMVAKGGWSYFEDADLSADGPNRSDRPSSGGPAAERPIPERAGADRLVEQRPSIRSAGQATAPPDLATGFAPPPESAAAAAAAGAAAASAADDLRPVDHVPDSIWETSTGGAAGAGLGGVLAAAAPPPASDHGAPPARSAADAPAPSLIQRLSQASAPAVDAPQPTHQPSSPPPSPSPPPPPPPLAALSFSPDVTLPDQPAADRYAPVAAPPPVPPQPATFATIQPLAPSPDPRQSRGPAVVVSETRIGDGLLVAAAGAFVAGVVWWAVVAFTESQFVYLAVLLGVLVGQAALVGGRRGSLGLGLVAGSLTLLSFTATQYFITRSLFIAEGGELPLWDGSSVFIDAIRATFENEPVTGLFVVLAAGIAGFQAGIPGRRASGPLGEIHASRPPDKIL